MAAQFFAPNAPTRFDEIMQGVANSNVQDQNAAILATKSADEADTLRRKLALNKVFSDAIATEPINGPDGTPLVRVGDIDEPKYYRGVKENGLDAQQAQTALEYHKAQKGAQANTALVNTSLRQMGYDPNAQGRNAPVGAPKTQEEAYLDFVDNKPAQATAPAATGGLSYDTLNAVARGREPAASVPDPFDSTPEDANTIRITAGQPQSTPEAKLTAVDMGTGEGAYRPAPVAPDMRTSTQAVEDSYNPANAMGGANATMPNPFRYADLSPAAKVKVDAYLAKTPLGSGQAGLDKMHEIYQQSVPVATMAGKGMEADPFGTQSNIAKTNAARAEAVEKMRTAIISGSDTVTSQDLAQASNRRSEQERAEGNQGFKDVQTSLAELRGKYDGIKVSSGNLAKAQELSGKVEGIQSLIRGTAALKAQIKKEPNMTPEKFGALVAPLDNQISVADQITTGEGTKKFFADLERRDPSLGQLIAHSQGGGVSALLDAVKKGASSLTKSQIVNLYETIGEHAMKYGVAASQMRGLGWTGGGLKPETVLKSGKKEPRKEGESYTDWLRRTAGK